MGYRIAPEAIVGRRYGRLVAQSFEGRDPKGNATFKCLCDCGNSCLSKFSDLNGGKTVSCKCYIKDVTRARSTKHGQGTRSGRTKKYQAFLQMHDRCRNPNNPQWKDWGGRGISVWCGWDTFEAFDLDVAKPPSSLHTLDRINTNGNYEPGNVQWSTRKEQNRNQRSNRIVELDGVSRCLGEWCEMRGIPYSRALHRLNIGLPISDVLNPERRNTGPKPS